MPVMRYKTGLIGLPNPSVFVSFSCLGCHMAHLLMTVDLSVVAITCVL